MPWLTGTALILPTVMQSYQAAAERPIPRLDQVGVKDLVLRLGSANGWERDMAQRMLLWRDEKPPETELRRDRPKRFDHVRDVSVELEAE